MERLNITDRWDAGLREDLGEFGAEAPFAEVAQDVEFNSSTGPTKREGFEKLTLDLPAPAALRLDGFHSAAVIDPTETGGSNLILTTNWTVLIEFAVRVLESGSSTARTPLWEYKEEDASKSNLLVYLTTTSGLIRAVAVVGDGTTSTTATSSVSLKLNTYYKVGVRYDGIKLSIRILGLEAWQDSAGFVGPLYQPVNIDGTDIHIHLGAFSRLLSAQDDNAAISRFLLLAAVNFHRIRVWPANYLTLDSEPTQVPTCEYRFTDMTSLRVEDAQGNCPDARIVEVGQNDFGSGGDRVDHRSNATWETASPLVGDASLRFDGYTNFIQIRDAFKYRKPQKNFEDISDDEDLAVLEEMEVFSLAIVFKLDQIRTCGLFAMSPVRTTTNVADPESSPDFYFTLWLDEDFPGGPAFRWSTANGAAAIESVNTNPATFVIATGVTYLILVERDYIAGTSAIRVATSSSAWLHEVTASGFTTTHNTPTEGNRFDERKDKYAFVLGSMIKGTRFRSQLDDPDDPNSYALRIHYHRMFKGLIDSFFVIEAERVTGGSGPMPKEYVLQLLDRRFRTEEMTAVAGSWRMLSAYFFDEPNENFLIDSGILGNHQDFIEDPDHAYVRNEASYTYDEAAPSPIDGIAEHFDPVFGRSLIVVAGPAVYRLDVDNQTIVPVGDGVRNVDGVQAKIIPYRGDLLIALEDRPLRYTGREVFPLGVETLNSNLLRYGLVQQGYETANLKEGSRRYRLVYYSSVTDEEGDWDSEIIVTISERNESNVIFGAISADDTVNDAFAIANKVNQRFGFIDSVNDGPFNITGGIADWGKAVIRWTITGGGPGAAGGFRHGAITGSKVAVFRSDVDDPEHVSAIELSEVLHRKIEKAVVHALPGARKIRFRTAYVGDQNTDVEEQATIELFPVSPLGSKESDLYNILGFTGTSTLGSGSDGGHSNRPLPTPMRSPQVTHVRFYRTAADGDTFYLAGSMEIGRAPQGYTTGRYWIDDVSDDDLFFRRPMDPRKGEPPKTKTMAELGGRVYYSDSEDEERLWFSETGLPNQVQPISFVDILDGRTLAINALERYAGVILILKEHATLVLTPAVSPLLPFDVEMRKPDVGCVSKLGVVSVQNSLYIADPVYARRFDSMTYTDVGYPVQRSWSDIPSSEILEMIAIHKRQTRDLLFANPSGDTWVYNYAKGAWSQWLDLNMRSVVLVEESERSSVLVFGDQYGNVFRMSPGALNDGGNFITDAVNGLGEELTGTGFVVAGDNVTLTGWAALTEADSSVIRGLKLFLDTLTLSQEVRALYVDSTGKIVTDGITTIPDGTYASGTWKWCRIRGEFISGEIRSPGIENFEVVNFLGDMHTKSGWPTAHSLTLIGKPASGIVNGGELTKTITASLTDFIMGHPFHGRAWRWGIRNENPDEPFGVSGMAFTVRRTPRGRPF